MYYNSSANNFSNLLIFVIHSYISFVYVQYPGYILQYILFHIVSVCLKHQYVLVQLLFDQGTTYYDDIKKTYRILLYIQHSIPKLHQNFFVADHIYQSHLPTTYILGGCYQQLTPLFLFLISYQIVF